MIATHPRRHAGWFLRLSGATLVAVTAGVLVGLLVAREVGGRQTLIVPAAEEVAAGLPAPLASPGQPIAQREAVGFRVSLYLVDAQPDSVLVRYSVSLPAGSGFTDMLGVPRFYNGDGSFVLPKEYGAVENVDLERPGLADGAQSAAVFESADIQPGAVLRFGPFFEALPGGAQIKATGKELRAGLAATVGGEEFVVKLADLPDGLATITFDNVADPASIVFSHPGSVVTAMVNGDPLKQVKGSTGFAKTESLDVNANTSSVTVAGPIPDDALVTITVDSTGRVVRGEWDFPLQ